jgi:hypothetical protein
VLRVCHCPDPVESANPRRRGLCNRCLSHISQGQPWAITDATHNAFLDRMESAIRAAENWPANKPPPAHWQRFRYLALERERAGRELFGHDYLTRDNTTEGVHEDIDGCNYLYFDYLQAIRNGDDEEWALILDAAYHDFKAHEARLNLKAKRAGAP